MNLLCAEGYKLRKSKCFFIMCALSIAFMLLQFATMYIYKTNGAKMIEEMGQQAETAMVREQVALITNMGTMDVLQKSIGAGSNSLICAVIFICVFALNEYGHGAMKNIVGKGYRKEQIYVTKFLVTEFGAVMMYIVTALGCLLGGGVYEGFDTLDAAFLKDYATYTLLNLLFLMSVTAIILFICEAVRNMAAGIAISLIGMVFVSGLLFQGIDAILQMLHIDVLASKYWIISIISECPATDISTKFMTRSGITAVVWLVLALIGGILLFRNRDVK